MFGFIFLVFIGCPRVGAERSGLLPGMSLLYPVRSMCCLELLVGTLRFCLIREDLLIGLSVCENSKSRQSHERTNKLSQMDY